MCPWRYPYPGDKRTTYVRRTKRVRLLYVRRTNPEDGSPLPPHFSDLPLGHVQEGLSASSELPEVQITSGAPGVPLRGLYAGLWGDIGEMPEVCPPDMARMLHVTGRGRPPDVLEPLRIRYGNVTVTRW